MGQAHLKILNLLKEGKVTVEEAERLLALVGEERADDEGGMGEVREFLRELPDAVVKNMREVYASLSEVSKTMGVKGKVLFAMGKDSISKAYASEKPFRVRLPGGVTEVKLLVSAKMGAVKITGVHSEADMLATGTRKGIAPDNIAFHADPDDAARGALVIESEAGTAECALHPGAVYDVEVDAGAGAVKLDLREIRVRSLKIENSLGGVSAKLGALLPDVSVEISNSAGKVKLGVPDGAGVRANVDTDMGAHNLDDFGLVRDGGAFVSAGYAESGVKVNIVLEQTVGSFKLKRN